MNWRRLTWVLCTCALIVGGCDDEGETDSAETVLEAEVVDDVGTAGVQTVDDGVVVAFDNRLVFVKNGTHSAETLFEGERVKGELAADDTFVYFASQRKDRFSSTTTNSLPDDGEPDGYLYRVPKKTPHKVEKLVGIRILTGPMVVADGQLFACSSSGLNSDGGVMVVPLDNVDEYYERAIGFNIFCDDVAANSEYLFVQENRKFGDSSSGGDSMVLTRYSQAGAASEKTELVTGSGVGAVTLRGDELALITGTQVQFLSVDGVDKGTQSAGVRGYLTILDGGYVWSKNSEVSSDHGRTCEGGRLYAGKNLGAGTELTQSVCSVVATATDKTNLWFVEAAAIFDNHTTRYRVKRLARPTL